MTATPDLVVLGYVWLRRDHDLIMAAARARGLSAELWNPSHISVEVGASGERVRYLGDAVTPLHVLPRGVNRVLPLITHVLDVWGSEGTRCVPTIAAALTCADKVATTRCLARAGVPIMPSTAVLGGPDYVANTLAQLPERALVVKPSFGSGGRDVVTYETRDAAVRALREITRQAHGSIEHHVVQPQATGARRDYRVVVANGKAVAGTQRTAGPGRFTTNGTSSSITPYRSAEIDEIAVAAATAIGLEFTGIDVIEHDGNMVVLEANAWPGLSLTGGVCGVNLAEVLLDVLLDTPES